jgi:ketosteroid isomerase-like protein
MWRWCILACLILASSVAAAQDQPSGRGDEATVRQIETDWADALAKGDAAAIEPILASDYKIVAPGGSMQTRDQSLGDIRSGAYKITEWTTGDDLDVRVFGDAAVVTGSNTEKSTYNGEDTSGRYRWMDVFVKRNGRWQAVASHVSRMEGS